eukprot:scaffold40989_cov161-Skeletonema_marinoi.AAC.1
MNGTAGALISLSDCRIAAAPIINTSTKEPTRTTYHNTQVDGKLRHRNCITQQPPISSDAHQKHGDQPIEGVSIVSRLAAYPYWPRHKRFHPAISSGGLTGVLYNSDSLYIYANMMNSNPPTRTTRRRCTSNTNSNNMVLTIALLMLITIASSPASSLTLAASPTSSSSSSAPSRSFSSSSSTAISATSTEAGISSTCVPPPNSRLAQLLRHQQSQSLPGTKNKQSGRRLGQNLRYATYPAADSVEGTTTAAAAASSSSLVAPLFYHGHGEDEELMLSEFQSSSLKSDDELNKKKKNTNTNDNSVEKKKKKDDHHVQIQRRRKRVRMLRPFSTRLKKKAASSSSSQQQLLQQQQEENKARLDEYEQRKAAWAAKYTSVSSLRTTFGTNKNKIF